MSAHLTSLFLFASNFPAIDTVRESLETDSSRWFSWLVRASILVGIGVVLEAPEATIALKRWYRLKRGNDVGPENEKSWVIPVAFLGLLLVVAGVAGEGIFEFLSARSETALRGHDEQILGATEAKFGQVKDSAEAAAKAAGQAEGSSTKANASAKEASETSGKAVESAGRAMDLAKGAREEADSYALEISAAKQQAADAVSRLADAEQRLADATQNEAKAEAALRAVKTPRSIVSAQKVVSDLRPFSGTEYVLSAFQDDESIQLTKVIAAVLQDAGWILKQPQQVPLNSLFFALLDNGPRVGVPLCIGTGISIDLHVDNPNSLIGKTLETAPQNAKVGLVLEATLQSNISPVDAKNVDPHILNPSPGKAPVGICVGKKP